MVPSSSSKRPCSSVVEHSPCKRAVKGSNPFGGSPCEGSVNLSIYIERFFTMQNIDEFYSTNSSKNWEKVLGDKMHYHFGLFEDELDPFDNAILEISQFIENNSKVLDCGCGWGGPARYLIKNKQCDVTGVTISKSQHDYVNDFRVFNQDLHNFIPDQHYDSAIFVESYCHLSDPEKVFRNLNKQVDNIIIKDYNLPKTEEVKKWGMIIRSENDVKEQLKNCGYEVKFYKKYKKEVTYDSVFLSTKYWLSNIQKLPTKDLNGQISILKDLCVIVQNYKKIGFDLFLLHAQKSDKFF